MIASSSSSIPEQHALLIYTSANDKTFDDDHFADHRELLGRAFAAESIRTGTLDESFLQSLESSHKFAVIEIAAHGGEDHIDLGDERLTMGSSKREKLRELVNRLNAHGVLILQTCRSGAVVANGRCFAEYLASLSDKPIRVIANQGTSFKLEFKRSNPVDVRYVNEDCDQTAWFYRCPDGRVVRMDLDLVDHLQKKLVDPADRELANHIAAGFGVDDFVKRFSELKLSIDDFKETRWRSLFERAHKGIVPNLLKLAILDRYGAILQHLDEDHRRKAMIALFGDFPDLAINMETFPEYLLCCLEIEGAFPDVLQVRDFRVVVGGCNEHYADDLMMLLEDLTIAVSFVQGTEWEIYLERLDHHKAELGGADLDDFVISPDQKQGEVIGNEGEIVFGLVPDSDYQKCRRNLLALAAAERFKGLLIHLDNGNSVLDNPAGIAFSKMTGWMAHPEELPFARSLGSGTTCVFDLVQRAFSTVDRGSKEECRLFRDRMSKLCLNYLYKEVSEYLQGARQLNHYSFDDLIAMTACVLKEDALEEVGLNEIPTRYSEKGFVTYHCETTVERFVDTYKKLASEKGVSVRNVDSKVEQAAIDLGYLKSDELLRFFWEEKLKDHLSCSEKSVYREMLRLIVRVNTVEVNRCLVEFRGAPTPLHVAAEYQDQKLISLLINLGACVDEVDGNGFVPRHYAQRCSFIPSERAVLMTKVETLGDNATFDDLLNLRKAVGTYDVYLTIKGTKKLLLEHIWDFFFINRPEEEIQAAKMLQEHIRIRDLRRIKESDKRGDRIILHMKACIKTLATHIVQDPENFERVPIVRQCLGFYGALINRLLNDCRVDLSGHMQTQIGVFSDIYQRKVLERMNLATTPFRYNQEGFEEYYAEMTREKFIAEFRAYLNELNFFEDVEKSLIELAVYRLRYRSESELEEFFEKARLKEYLLSSDKDEYQMLNQEIFYFQSLCVNCRLNKVNDAPTPLHIAAKNHDQTLVTFLVNLGALVDMVDARGLTARHYANDLNFFPGKLLGHPKSTLELTSGEVTFNDVMRLKDAVGSYAFCAYLRSGSKPIFEHLWDCLSGCCWSEAEIFAARAIKDRVKLDLEQFDILKSAEIDEERADRIIKCMVACIKSLAEIIKHNPEIIVEETAIRLGLEQSRIFIHHWKQLKKVVDDLHMTRSEEISLVVFSAERHLSPSQMIEWLVRTNSTVSTLLLYSYYKENPEYTHFFEKRFSSVSARSLLLTIGHTFTRIELLGKHHKELADRLSSGVLECLFERLAGGPEALAAFIVEREFPHHFSTLTRLNLYARLDRDQKLFLYQKGKQKQYYESLIRFIHRSDTIGATDERIFTLLSDEPLFVEAYIEWMKSLSQKALGVIG